MARKFREKLRKANPFTRPETLDELPRPLPADPDQRLVKVYVEGYEDVAFWRGIFDHFQNPYLRFEISVPDRGDLPKGKKVLLGTIPRSSEELLLCVDSDFDYLFAGRTEQSREVLGARYMFHTYAYATENYLCYAPSLHNVCVKATKNDTRIFDFVHKASVRIGYLDLEQNGARTIEWLQRNVEKREKLLQQRNPRMIEPMKRFEEQLRERGVKPENTYLFMHGHTLMDNVVMILLNSVCEKLRAMSIARITASQKQGVALKNEMSNYTNSLRSIRDVLLDNENYTKCPLYKRLQRDIERYIARTILEMKRSGQIKEKSVFGILHKMRQGME